MNDSKTHPLTPSLARERGGNPQGNFYERLEREIHGLLVDLRIAEPKRDEFIDQEDMVKRFMEAWAKAVGKIEEKVLKQVEKGKIEVEIQ